MHCTNYKSNVACDPIGNSRGDRKVTRRKLVRYGCALVILALGFLSFIGYRQVGQARDGEIPPRDPELPMFALYAEDSLTIGPGSHIKGGAVGVASSTSPREGGPEFQVSIEGAKVDGDVYGDSVFLGPRSHVGDVFANRLVSDQARHGRVEPFPRTLPSIGDASGIGGSQDAMIVPARSTVGLDRDYTDVTVEPNGTLLLLGGRYELSSLVLGEGARLEVQRGPSLLVVFSRLEAWAHSYIGPVDESVEMNLTLLVLGEDGHAPAAASFGEHSTVHASIRVPDGSLVFGNRAKGQGVFYARSLEVGEKAKITRFPWPDTPAEASQCEFPICVFDEADGVICAMVVLGGLPCSDGNVCTKGDVCTNEGACIPGPPLPDPDPQDLFPPCLTDTCDPIAGYKAPLGIVCDFPQCLEERLCNGIGGCAIDGAPKPFGTPCDDGIPNNGADVCTGTNSNCFGPLGPFDCTLNTCSNNPGEPPDLDCWLDTHPAVKNKINWRDQNSTNTTPYAQWTGQQKQELTQAFLDAWQWFDNGMTNFPGTLTPDPPPNLLILADTDGAGTVLDEPVAWQLYLAQVGHMLAVEIRGEVPWTICDYDPFTTMFAALFSSYQGESGYYSGFSPNYDPNGDATPTHPTVTYSFLHQEGLIGTSRLETIGKLLDWARKLHHVVGPYTAGNFENFWQYRGSTPVSSVISGTDALLPGATQTQFEHWTSGCHGTSAFLKQVLRAVNIPVELLKVPAAQCHHATPYFSSEGRYLSHGDDVHTGFQEGSTTVVPALGDIMIDQATYLSWFTGPPSYICTNVGRRSRELVVELLPDWLVKSPYHCKDLLLNKSHADSNVYAWLAPYFTVQELEAQTLWTRLDQRVIDLGLSCGGP
jgi:hypothetical protein